MNLDRVEIPLVIFLLLLLTGCGGQAPTTVTPISTLPLQVAPSQTITPPESPAYDSVATPSATELPIIEVILDRTPGSSVQDLKITQIHMTSETSGWAFGLSGQMRLVLHTADGGRSWRDVTPPIEKWSDYIDSPRYTVPQLGDGTFYDDRLAWISTDNQFEGEPPFSYAAGAILSTADAGATWRIQLLQKGQGAGYGRFVGFLDQSHGWFTVDSYAGAGGSYTALYGTSDKGESWELLLDVLGTVSSATAELAFGNATTGIMTFERSYYINRPYVRWTDDGGKTWGDFEFLPEPDDPSASDPTITEFQCGTAFPHAFSELEAALIVECRITRDFSYIYSNFLYSTEDGGLSWQSFPVPRGSLYLLSPSVGWMLGKEIYITENSGFSWTKVNEVTWDGQFNFINARHGWAVATNGDEIALVKTEDGGRNWFIVEPRLLP